MRALGTFLLICSVVLALLGIGAFVFLVLGLKEDALAAAPAFLVSEPWSSLLMPETEDGKNTLVLKTALMAVFLSINPLILFLLGRWLRRRN